jgi:hypothetical protein
MYGVVSFPWGLLFLLILSVTVFVKKRSHFLEEISLSRLPFLIWVLAVLFASYIVIPLGNSGAYLNGGGLVACILGIYLISKLNLLERARTFLAMMGIFFVVFATTSGMFWEIEKLLPFWLDLLPLIVAAVAFVVTDSLKGAFASLILGLWAVEAVSIIGFTSLNAIEVGGFVYLNMWLVASLLVFVFILLQEVFLARRIAKKAIDLD